MILKKILLLLILTVSLSVSAAHRATPEEARAMFDKAIATYQGEGQKAALAKFNQLKGDFIWADLYVFALDESGTYLASGANPDLVGTSLASTADASGNLIFDKIKEALASDNDPGTLDYIWLNRQTNQIESKTSFVKNIDGTIIGVGYYH